MEVQEFLSHHKRSTADIPPATVELRHAAFLCAPIAISRNTRLRRDPL
jgi:hypothetical protein